MMQQVQVFRNGKYDCTNGGLSSRADTLMAVTADELPLKQKVAYPVAVLENHVRGCLRLVPLEVKEANKWAMFGGNFAYTSDGRFHEACEKLLGQRFYGAVAIHDRVEG